MGMTSVLGQFSGNELLDRADSSMYHSKKKGRSRLTYSEGYGPSTIIATSERILEEISGDQDTEGFQSVEQANSSAAIGVDDSNEDVIIDITESQEQVQVEGVSQSTVAGSAAKDSPITYKSFHRFSLDYIDIAKIRVALSELTNNFDREGSATALQMQNIGVNNREIYVHSDNDARIELIQPLVGKAEDAIIDLPLIEELAARKISASATADTFRDAKFLIPIDDVSGSAKDRIPRALEDIVSRNHLDRKIVLSISAKRLARDDELMISLIAIAIRYRLEVMVTDVEDRSTRFYDLCSPVVTYFAIEAAEVVGDTNRPAPTKMSTLLAIARERGVRIVATNVTNPSMVDALLATGVSVVDSSELSLVDLMRRPLEPQSFVN